MSKEGSESVYGALQDVKGAVPKPKHTRQPRKRLTQHARVNPVNVERRAQTKAIVEGPQWAACHLMPCIVCGAEPPSEAHHVEARQYGGVGGDDSRCVPLCTPCHRRHDHMGALSFWESENIHPDDAVQWVQEQMEKPSVRYYRKVLEP